MTADNFSTFRSAVVETARARPQDDVVSNLLGYCHQIAQRLGKDKSAAELAGEAGVSEPERVESAAWDGLIEQWEIAGPFHTQNSDLAFTPDTTGAAKAAVPVLPPSLVWVKTDSRQELGVIRLGPLLGLSAAESAGQFAYARTTITSPVERSVAFCLGSDDWSRVWVNGQLVNTWIEGRPCYLDQDRFTVKLKKGDNQVLIKIGNLSDAWNFCLRLAEDNAVNVVAGNQP